MPRKNYQTIKCAFRGCRKNAMEYGGHLHTRDRIVVIAGWCRGHVQNTPVKHVPHCRMPVISCNGWWTKRMGREEAVG